MTSDNKAIDRLARCTAWLALVSLSVFIIAVVFAVRRVGDLSHGYWVIVECGFCAMILFSTIAFVLQEITGVKRQVMAQIESGAMVKKRNDPHWCMGVFGIIGGSFLILLTWHNVIEVVRNYPFALLAIAAFLIGLNSYVTWRWKRAFMKSVEEMRKAIDEMEKNRHKFENTSDKLDKMIDEIE